MVRRLRCGRLFRKLSKGGGALGGVPPTSLKGQKTEPEITGFERRLREEKAAPVLSLLKGARIGEWAKNAQTEPGDFGRWRTPVPGSPLGQGAGEAGEVRGI